MKEKTNCRICGIEVFMLRIPLCDSCWELKRRIDADLVIAEKILQELKDIGGGCVKI